MKKQGNPGWLGFLGDEDSLLPSHEGIVKKNIVYKDPY